MIHLIWIIPGYIAAGFLLAMVAQASSDDAPLIVLYWPLFACLFVLAGIIEGIRRVYIKMENDHENKKR